MNPRPAMEEKAWQLITQLLEVTRDWNAHDLIEHETRTTVRRIGTELNALGGYDLMLFAYRTARTANRYTTAIQAYWDGIGPWRW